MFTGHPTLTFDGVTYVISDGRSIWPVEPPSPAWGRGIRAFLRDLGRALTGQS